MKGTWSDPVLWMVGFGLVTCALEICAVVREWRRRNRGGRG